MPELFEGIYWIHYFIFLELIFINPLLLFGSTFIGVHTWLINNNADDKLKRRTLFLFKFALIPLFIDLSAFLSLGFEQTAKKIDSYINIPWSFLLAFSSYKSYSIFQR